MENDAGMPVSCVRADGGASANNFLMQFQADVLNADVIRPAIIESSALGAACLAGLGVQYFKNREDIVKNTAHDTIFKPAIKEKDRVTLLAGWDEAVKRSFGRPR